MSAPQRNEDENPETRILSHKVEALDEKIDKIDDKLDKLSEVITKLTVIDERVITIQENSEKHLVRISELEQKVAEQGHRLKSLEEFKGTAMKLALALIMGIGGWLLTKIGNLL